MEKSFVIRPAAWGPQILTTLLGGAIACENYNCADTATCTFTSNANKVDAGVDAGASTLGPSSSASAPRVDTSYGVATSSDGERGTDESPSGAGGTATDQLSAPPTTETEFDAGNDGRTFIDQTSTPTAVTTSQSDSIADQESTTGESAQGDSLGDYCNDDADCASGHCADGVCCDATCDDVCAACDIPGQQGTCSATTADNACGRLACPASTECRTVQGVGLEDNCIDIGECRTAAQCNVTDIGQGVPCAGGEGQCDGQGECVVPDKLALGRTCTSDDECGSSYCASTASGGSICCSSACEGTCQACGADGQCNKAPAHDDACDFTCPTDTSCATYPDAPVNNCVGFGVCLARAQFCTESYLQEGALCGPSEECDGVGQCIHVDRTPPSVVAVSPSNSSTDVDRDVVLEITFSEPIDEDSIRGAATLFGPDGEVEVTLTLSDAATLVVSPNVTLPLIAEHRIELSSAVRDLAGNPLAGAPYRSVFTTRDGVWDTTATLLETNNAANAYGLKIAYDRLGNIMVAWYMYDDATRDSWYSRFDNTSKVWGGASKLSDDREIKALALLPDDGVLGVELTAASPFSLSSRRRVASSGTWEAAVPMEATNDSIVWVDVAYGGAGQAVAVWVQESSASPPLRSLHSSQILSGVWQPPKTLVAPQADAILPAVAMGPTGDSVCIWGRGTAIYQSRLANGANSWTANSSIATGQVWRNPDISADATGAFFAIWANENSGGNRVPVIRRLGGINGSWGSAVELWDEAVLAGTAYHEHMVVADGVGGATAAWYGRGAGGSAYQIFTSDYSSSGWSSPMAHVPEGNDGYARFQRISSDGRGNTMLTWSQPSYAGGYQHFARRRTARSGWGEIREFHAPTNPFSFNMDSSVAFGRDGEATIAWVQNDGTRDNVWALRFR